MKRNIKKASKNNFTDESFGRQNFLRISELLRKKKIKEMMKQKITKREKGKCKDVLGCEE